MAELEPAPTNGRPSGMHGTLPPRAPAAAKRGSNKAKLVKLGALAMLAGIVVGAALFSIAQNDDLMIFLGFSYPKDCG
jgi:hypothetical protein